jgi:hypothetical protein
MPLEEFSICSGRDPVSSGENHLNLASPSPSCSASAAASSRDRVARIFAEMNYSRAALIAAATGFAGFGIACLLQPDNMLQRVDIRARSARGTTELRAMYGGMELGLGIFFAAAIFRREWRCPALWAQALGLGGLAASRLAGVLHDRPPGLLMPALVAAEGSATALAIAGLKAETRGSAGRE